MDREETIEKVREKIEARHQLLNFRDKLDSKGVKSLILVSVIVLFFAGFMFFQPPVNTDVEPENEGPELTKYQKNYVDCPEKYLELCTKKSKIPTEEVVFDRVEGDKLYLDMPRTNRTMIVKMKEDRKSGYIIRITP